MNAARWWSLDPQLGLPMIDPGAWVGALPAANPLLVSTFADGASLAATGSARSVITAVTGAPPLRAAAWEAGGGAWSAVLVDDAGAVLHEVTTPAPRRLLQPGPAAPRPAPIARPADGHADAEEVLELLDLALRRRVGVELRVVNRALTHAARGVIEGFERIGELVLIDAGAADLYLDLPRLGRLRLVAAGCDLPDLEGVSGDGALAVSLRWREASGVH